jgi:hypothetical protein
MARKTKTAKNVAKASAARAGAKDKGSPGGDVERRWKEYWACRTKLEDAVEKVKAARDGLQSAQDAERSCRAEFEGIKRSLTSLLDVEPAGNPQRPPTAIPKPPSMLPGPASASESKPAS